jgi:hypothetical protein
VVDVVVGWTLFLVGLFGNWLLDMLFGGVAKGR